MDRGLTGTAALVMGGATGIGRGIADRLSELGAAVGIADIDGDSAARAAAELRERGRTVAHRRCDLGVPDEVRGTVEALWTELGRIDVLVNNAASHGPRAGVLDYRLEDWSQVLAANLSGTFLTSTEVARRMVAAGIAGSIISILAIQATIPLPGYCAYVASKGGLEAFTRVLAVELAPHRIRANGIVLGAIFSGSTAPTLTGRSAADVDFEAVPPDVDDSAATLVGRMGRPSDVAAMVAFLASRESSYLTGSMVVLDGGRLLNRGRDSLTVEPRS